MKYLKLCLCFFFMLPVFSLAQTPILGPSTTTVYQMQEWAVVNEADPLFVELANTFYSVAMEKGIDPAVIYTQSAKETNFMRFTGVLDASFHNPCGLKTTGGGANEDPNAHMRFVSWEEGITAMADHLALYAGAAGYPKLDSPDPRHFPSIAGTAPFVEDLGGKWAPFIGYGRDIVARMHHLYSMPTQSVFRLAGDNRYATALDITNYFRRKSGDVILVNGTKAPDALTASTLAAQLKAPMLMIGQQSITDDVLMRLQDLEAKRIVLLGGENSISQNIEALLEKEKYEVTRIAGANRYDTAEQIMQTTHADMENQKRLILASGENLSDALAISAVAANENIPVLLTSKDTLPPSIEPTLYNAEEVIIVGGVNSVSQAIENALSRKGVLTTRIAGANRYDTALHIANTYFPNAVNFFIANGAVPYDALVSGALAGKYDGPILLVNPISNNEQLHEYLEGQYIRRIALLGGEMSSGPLSNFLKYK